ncbi:hypothetical protein [Trichormus azollae]|uniref:hypothetical protein n=1 Tax=Trichormus azollae TaxID=1164 RepID=UPI00325E42A8
MKRHWLLLGVSVVVLLTIRQVLAQNKLQVRVNRYLEVRKLSKYVTYQNKQGSIYLAFVPELDANVDSSCYSRARNLSTTGIDHLQQSISPVGRR